MMTVYRGWWVVLVSSIGLMLHYGPVISGTFGVFLKPLSEEFGWSRTEISLGFSISTLVLSAALPIVGRLLDRHGARTVIVPSLLLFGLGVVSFSILLPELWHFYAIYVLLGVVGSGSTPVSFSKVNLQLVRSQARDRTGPHRDVQQLGFVRPGPLRTLSDRRGGAGARPISFSGSWSSW